MPSWVVIAAVGAIVPFVLPMAMTQLRKIRDSVAGPTATVLSLRPVGSG